MKPEFDRLSFGFADAAREAERKPELLLDGFYDPAGLAAEVLDGDIWLMLGAKGSGKSAIVEHLKLLHESSDDIFVRSYDLYEFPYRDFVELDSATDVSIRLPSNWRWVLLLAIMDSFDDDIFASGRESPEFKTAIKVLRKAGFLSRAKLNELVRDTNTASVSSVLHGITGTFGKSRQKRGIAIAPAVQTLTELVGNFYGRAKHFVVLDGLDKQFASGQVQWDAITSLVLAVDSLNSTLRKSEAPAKVIILIRPDMFDRLRSAEISKIRRDSGHSINWFPSSAKPEESELFDLVNRKASVSAGGGDLDVVAGYLPKQIVPRGGPGTPIPIHKYLIDRTRHTPRDMGQLLESIRQVSGQRGNLGQPISQDMVIDAANHYAFDYFYGDVRSAMVGLIEEPDIDALFSLLKTAPGDKFSRRWLLEKAQERGISLRAPDEALQQLHQAGAVTNVDRQGRVAFIYAQPTAELDTSALMSLQRTFARGLNRAPLWMATRNR